MPVAFARCQSGALTSPLRSLGTPCRQRTARLGLNWAGGVLPPTMTPVSLIHFAVLAISPGRGARRVIPAWAVQRNPRHEPGQTSPTTRRSLVIAFARLVEAGSV